jgi:hypothetical protein
MGFSRRRWQTGHPSPACLPSSLPSPIRPFLKVHPTPCLTPTPTVRFAPPIAVASARRLAMYGSGGRAASAWTAPPLRPTHASPFASPPSSGLCPSSRAPPARSDARPATRRYGVGHVRVVLLRLSSRGISSNHFRIWSTSLHTSCLLPRRLPASSARPSRRASAIQTRLPCPALAVSAFMPSLSLSAPARMLLVPDTARLTTLPLARLRPRLALSQPGTPAPPTRPRTPLRPPTASSSARPRLPLATARSAAGRPRPVARAAAAPTSSAATLAIRATSPSACPPLL